jgi:hypothetical protein
MIEVVRIYGVAIPARYCLVKEFTYFLCNSDCSHISTVTATFHPLYAQKLAKFSDMFKWSK